jgi:hypothetical protein
VNDPYTLPIETLRLLIKMGRLEWYASTLGRWCRVTHHNFKVVTERKWPLRIKP